MSTKTIDINCDMGESWHTEIIGQDAALMPYLTSCNLACGLHGGDDETMAASIALAARYGVAIGAHPSLPDRANFGREELDLPAEELFALVLYQVQKLQAAVVKQGQKIYHLKAHGALYNLATVQENEAIVICRVGQKTGIKLVYGPPGSELERQAKLHGLSFVAEGFIDRIYANGLQLRSRKLPDSVIHDSDQAAQQALLLARDGVVLAHDGNLHPHHVQTLCLHGDHVEALDHIRKVQTLLAQHGIEVKPI